MEVDEIVIWITGYSKKELKKIIDSGTKYIDFFQNALSPNEIGKLIKGSIYGIKVEGMMS